MGMLHENQKTLTAENRDPNYPPSRYDELLVHAHGQLANIEMVFLTADCHWRRIFGIHGTHFFSVNRFRDDPIAVNAGV